MVRSERTQSSSFLKSLGFPTVEIHDTFSHFDFTESGRRILLIGPMGSGKTEFAARIWRDAAVARGKSDVVAGLTSTEGRDRRRVFFIRSKLDGSRFTGYPADALPYRGGYVRCGDNMARVGDSFELEAVIKDHPDVGTYIIDEASFFDERLAYVVRRASLEQGVMFVFPTLVLNFRREFFNETARLMVDIATDVYPLTAYCEHPDCMEDAFYTYRCYHVDGRECPALYFDPLVIVGGDREKGSALEPDYESRCDKHHYLPGKEYSFLTLKPLAQEAAKGNQKPLEEELGLLHDDIGRSLLAGQLKRSYQGQETEEVMMDSLRSACIAEKALAWLFAEQNAIGEGLLRSLVRDLGLDVRYLSKVLEDNRRPVDFRQMTLL